MDLVDAQRVVRFLTAAFPTYPIAEDTAELYVDALVPGVHDAAVAYAVVQDWVSSRVTFPRVAEILEECDNEAERRAKRAKAIAAGQRNPEDGMVSCTSCDDDKVEWTVDESGHVFSLPCRVCEPLDHADQAEGHVRYGHDVDGCEWPRCKRRAKMKHRPRRDT